MSERLITVVIDVPRGSFIKRSDDGSVDFVSPFPSPFNYGHVPNTVAEDGEGFDAVVLGSRLARGSECSVAIQGKVGFLDGGVPDPKWICAPAPLSTSERRRVEGFFRRYAWAKRWINRLRGKQGRTSYLGWL